MPLPSPDACTSCGTDVAVDDIVHCTACRATHHIDCWRARRGCAAPDCACRICERPCEDLPAEREGEDKETWVYADADGSLVIDSHVPAVEEPLAGVMVMGCLGVLAGYFFSAWAYTMGWYALGTGLLLFTIASSGFRHRLRVQACGGGIERSLRFFSRQVSRDGGYLFLDELVELHLHSKTEEEKANEHQRVRFTLFGLASDGQRRLMFTRKSRNATEVHRIVEQVAQAADVTVRHFKDSQLPSPKEIADAVRQRRLEAPLGLPSKPGP